MRRLLSSWLLFAAVWIPAHALAAVLVERRLSLTGAAFWSALLVPLVQAIAVESLDRPLLDSSILRALRSVARSPRLRVAGAAGALALLVEAGSAMRWLPIDIAPIVAASILALAVALLAFRALTLRSFRHGALAIAGASAGAALANPHLADLLPELGGPPAAPGFVAIAGGTIAGAALALGLARRAPEIAAEHYAGAAGAIVAAGVIRAVPALLGIPFDAPRMLPVAMLLTFAATAASVAALAEGGAEGRS